MKKISLIAGIIVFFILIATTPTQACKCAAQGSGEICEDYWKTPSLFSGKVVQIDKIEVKPGVSPPYSLRTKFAVIDGYRGMTGETIEIRGGTECSYKFELNESYLVFASGSEGNLSATVCGRTKKLAEDAADLEYIRGLPNAPPGAAVTGEVRFSGKEKDAEYTPASGTMVVIENDNGRFETITDASGKFSFGRLPAGRYTIRPLDPPGYKSRYHPLYIELIDKGCGYRRFVFEPKQ